MITYVVLASFTDQGIRNAKDTIKRADAFKEMAKKFGVTVKEIFWTQGRYDIVRIVEAQDELSATALNMNLGAVGKYSHANPTRFCDRRNEADHRKDGVGSTFAKWRRNKVNGFAVGSSATEIIELSRARLVAKFTLLRHSGGR
jgi:uncharacterized protein with GYD domain